MAYNQTLATRIQAYLESKKLPLEAKPMMGGICFMVRGKMCVGIEKNRLMARIGPDAYEDALHRTGCYPMDFTGRPMRGFVFVDGTVLGSASTLNSWLDLALEYNQVAPQSRKRKSVQTKTLKKTRPR